MSDDTGSATRGQPGGRGREARRRPGRGRSADALDTDSNWLSRMGAAVRRRSGVPPALYHLQAYKSWAAKIRRDWKETEPSGT